MKRSWNQAHNKMFAAGWSSGSEEMTENATVRSVSDTAHWVAYFRALETRRPDALFRDPHAERLAGDRGFHIANTIVHGNKHEWAWVTRTYLFDQFVAAAIQDGATQLVNLAAGLDARPYRMQLPAALRWVEVDMPEIVSYKEKILANVKPNCQLERVGLDLSDEQGRRKLFANLDRRSLKTAVVSEGLLIYLTNEQVASLARDLAECTHFRSWIVDLASPGQLSLMQRSTGRELSQAGAAFKFGPSEGANFFPKYGWEPREVRGMLATAAALKRAPSELLSLLPEPKRMPPAYPWTGVCVLKKR